MFFMLSKVMGPLTDPWWIGLGLLAFAGILRLAHSLPRLRLGALILGVLVLWGFSTGIVANLLFGPREKRFTRPAKLDEAPAAIVVLSGLTDDRRDSQLSYELTEAADRFVEAVRLARRYPEARLLLSGGPGEIRPPIKHKPEAQLLGELAADLGIPPSRLLLDITSRNTHENAVQTQGMLAKAKLKGPVLLVTSAVHMRRALAAMNKAGLKPIPWPVDYQRSDGGYWAWLPIPASMERSRMAIHEYVGWLAYSLARYI